VPFGEKLGEKCHRKSKKLDYKNTFKLESIRKKDMTYILGARCSDGVVLVADTKITIDGGADYAYSKKLTNPLTTIVSGASGIGGLYKDFQNRIVTAVIQMEKEKQLNQDTTPLISTEEEFYVLVNKIIRNMHDDYSDDRGLIINNLMIFCASKVNGLKANLTAFNPYGFPEPVDGIRAIGHGEPYGAIFLKKMWNKNMTMEQTAKLGLFILKFIQDMKLDNSVGFDNEYLPQVYYIPDTILPMNPTQMLIEQAQEKYKIRELSDEEVTMLLNEVSSKVSQFDSLFKEGEFKI
jgi:20S proteasome alpha/beta subunit